MEVELNISVPLHFPICANMSKIYEKNKFSDIKC